MAAEVYWSLVAGPERQGDPRAVDIETWVWILENVVTGARVEFRCTVTGPGKMANAADVSKRAHESKGCSEALKALIKPDPPRPVVLGADGYIVQN